MIETISHRERRAQIVKLAAVPQTRQIVITLEVPPGSQLLSAAALAAVAHVMRERAQMCFVPEGSVVAKSQIV